MAKSVGAASWPASYTQLERLETAWRSRRLNDVVVKAHLIRGALDRGRLVAAFDRVVARHAAVTVAFAETRDGIVMVPRSHRPALAVTPAVSDKDEALAYVREELTIPFDLSASPLLRARLFRLSAGAHLLVTAADHIVLDAASSAILLRDLCSLYGDLSGEGDVSGQAPLPMTFGDWAVWERQRLRGPRLDRLTRYWAQQLDRVGPLPDSGLVDPDARPAAQPPGRVRLDLDAPAAAQIYERARLWRVTPFSVLSAVLKATVWHQRARVAATRADEDVTVFGALPNRLIDDVQQVVGYFANSVVLCTSLAGDPSLQELVHRETRTLFGAMRFQDLPHALIVKALRPWLYGVRYWGSAEEVPQYLNFDVPDAHQVPLPAVPGLSITAYELPVLDHPRGGLRIKASLSGATIRIEVRHDPAKYGTPWVRLFVAGLREMLRRWPADPALAASAVDPFARSDRH